MTNNEKTFTNGLIIKSITTQFGEIKKLSFKVDEFITFLNTHNNNGWVNIDCLKNQSGKEYGVLNHYVAPTNNTNIASKKTPKQEEISIEEIPF